MFAGRLTLRQIRAEASNAFSFVFDKPRATWLAGQHFMLLHPHIPFDRRGVTRVFTISSAPEEDCFTCTTRYFGNSSSSFKRRLFGMKPGARLWAFGPSPVYDCFRALDTSRQYVFLAGGLGITPVRATLKHHALTSGNPESTLIYASRDDGVIFKQELIDLQDHLPALDIVWVTSPQHIDAAIIIQAAQRYRSPRFLVSGSRRFVSAMTAILRYEAKVQKKDISADSFRSVPLGGGGL